MVYTDKSSENRKETKGIVWTMRRMRVKTSCQSMGRVLALMSVVMLVLGTGCATTQAESGGTDPLESMNRSMHEFNDNLDKYMMKPVADGYVAVTHENIRLSVSNFYDNLLYLNVIANDFLQGKVSQGFSDLGRLTVNTTLGVGGLFDAASVFGIDKHQEDFGQTLAVWGVEEGPYIVAPLLGPTTGRDVLDNGSTALTNILTYVQLPVLVAGFTVAAPILVLGVIDKRARVESALQARDEMALDSYVFTREAYLQNRTFHIHDGNPPTEDLFAEIEDIEDEMLEFEEESIPEGKSSDLMKKTSNSPNLFIDTTPSTNGHGLPSSPSK